MTLAATDPVIVGVGLMTAVGLTAAETAASVRSNMMRFEESPILDRRLDPVVMARVPADGLPGLSGELSDIVLTGRERRLLRLLTMPLHECLAALPERVGPVPLILALPDQATHHETDPEAFLAALRLQVPDVLDAERMAAPFNGRAGGLISIGRAADVIRSGQADFIVAGGVDTFHDLMLLVQFEMEGRLKTAENLDGFIPGEAAALLLVTRRSTAATHGLPVLSAIGQWAHGYEAGHLYSSEPYRGDGLATTVASVIDSDSAAGEVYSSMNGESHWAKEWGVTVMRNHDAFVDGGGMHHPADCYGDTGAAAGPAMAGLAAVGIAAGYRRPPCLVYASSDAGQRAALTLGR